MYYNYRIHNFSHLVKSVFGHVLFCFFLKTKDQLIVLNYHGTQKKFIANFTDQLNFLEKNYEIISPVEFNNLITGVKPIKGKKLLLTFDDGIKNNRLAIEVLNKRNISAYFFVVPAFIDTLEKDQKRYFIQNIRPVINPFIDDDINDFLALSWDDLFEISKEHVLGCHTYSHTMIKDFLDEYDLEKEIIESKKIIESRVGVRIDSFCSINNTLLTVGKKEKQLVEKNYSYHFTTFGGNNINIDSFLIKRINVESHWLKGAFKFALSPFETNRWSEKIKFFKESTK
jgi:peptidoglycan/xylan/chitin deacetylase (PgdA/CDA1 family)